jgi:tetratricopeptide (TPR) repeat protein
MKFRKIFAIVSCTLFAQVAFAQTNKEIALDKGKKAIELMDDGKIDESIVLLKEAQQLDPTDINYPYELGYAYYSKNDYKKAVAYCEAIIDHKDVNDRVYQLLGNAYDLLGNPEKAIKTYEAGIKLFPNSGNLYLELGNMQIKKEAYQQALKYYEKGVAVAPYFPSNYYWAAMLYLSSEEEIWGMIYGEIFMNLERNTKRTATISELLYTSYKNEIKIINDTAFSVSFSKSATLNVEDLQDSAKFKLPFGMGVYEPTLLMAIINNTSIDIHTLSDIRSRFVDIYYQNNHNEQYPIILFDYQKRIKDAGHMDAYNHWILMKGDEEGFTVWKQKNQTKWEDFLNWFAKNKLQITAANYFHREKI